MRAARIIVDAYLVLDDSGPQSRIDRANPPWNGKPAISFRALAR
jgi:hypothetical protein